MPFKFLTPFVTRYTARTAGFAIHSVGENEGHFSWRECNTCGNVLGGRRTPCLLLNPGDLANAVNVESCDECVVYAANGTVLEEMKAAR